MNHAYRLVWSDAAERFVPVPETAKGRGKSPSRGAAVVALCAALLASGAWAGPSGGSVSAGSGSISHSGATTTITQGSQNLAINWASFGIAAGERVNFVQPGASAIALNRVIGAESSVINGTLSANGQVWILNPNGVLFGNTASVNVGGLVASTLSLSDADFLAGKRSFSANGSQGTVVNQGSLTGGYVALLGKQTSNSGTITTANGTAALAAGDKVTLDFSGNRLLSVQVNEGTLNALAENKGLIRADNGTVILSASAKEALLSTVVNNEGVIEAKGIDSSGGTILLLGGFNGGTVKVAGTLDASASGSHNGGFIETSGAHVQVAGGAKVRTLSQGGKTGTWLVDPTDFTIGAGSASQATSGIGADTLSANLATTSVTLATDASTGTDSGDIHVNAAVSWSANTTLTLNAYNDIHINAPITATGTSAGLVLNHGNYASTGTVAGGTDYHVKAPITLSGANATLGINGTGYTLLHSMAEIDAIDSTGLNGNYALAQDLDAGGITYGSALVGASGINFNGRFAGLGHTISNLVISAGSTREVGLFSISGGTIRDLGLLGGSVSGGDRVGLLAGMNMGSISNAYATGTVSGIDDVGGLVGYNANGSISNAYATGSVSGTGNSIGGLAGGNFNSTIDNAYATGSVLGTASVAGISYYIGGLVGRNSNASISNAYATGSVSGTGYLVGGLVGANSNATIDNAYATGSVSAAGGYGGGLAGLNEGTLINVYATGNVSGGTGIGGLVGWNANRTISNAYATGSVSGSAAVGGLVGENDNGTITTSYATGRVSGGVNLGGLVGLNNGSLSNAYWDSTTTGQAAAVGTNDGFVNDGTVTNVNPVTSGTAYSHASYTSLGTWTETGSGSGTWVASDGSGNPQWVMVEGASRPFLYSEYSTSIRNAHQLQLMAYNLAASYSLAVDIDASEAAGANPSGMWTTAGFSPVGNGTVAFNGSLDGQGHTIGNLTIDRGTASEVGLFGQAGNASVIRNVGLLGGSITGYDAVGSLVGDSRGSVSNAYAAGTVVSGGANVGGLVGLLNGGSISDAYAAANVTGANDVGGLVGYSTGSSISGSYAAGTVAGSGVNAGGLVGRSNGSNISEAYATANVTGVDGVGGLVGYSTGSNIGNAYATGAVSGANAVGGLLGIETGGIIHDAHATGAVTASGNDAGGLVGINNGTISGAYATNTVTSSGANAGGLVGSNGGNIVDAHATGTVNGAVAAGGLVGRNSGSVSRAYAVGTVTGTNDVGGLVGHNAGSTSSIDNVYATGTASASNAYAGGLVGRSSAGSVSNAYATGSVSAASGYAGGLMGWNDGGIVNTYATGAVSGASDVGRLVGHNAGSITASFWLGAGNTGVGTDAGSVDALTRGLSTSEATSASTYSAAGWNIATIGGSSAVWRIYEGGTMPLLRSFLTALTVTADGVSKTYDGTTSLGSSHTLDPGADTSLIMGTARYDSSSKDVGSHAINVGGLYSSQQGYDLISAGTASITAAALTVTANNDSRVADGTAYSGGNGVSYSGFVNGETASVLGGSLVYGGSAQGATAAGSYSIAASGLSSGNYTLSYVEGALVISAAGPGPIPPIPIPPIPVQPIPVPPAPVPPVPVPSDPVPPSPVSNPAQQPPVPLVLVASNTNPSLGDMQQRAQANQADLPKLPANPPEPLRIEQCGLRLDQPATDFFTLNENKLSCMSRLESR
jgi:filamentous hemagglutinin family protein